MTARTPLFACILLALATAISAEPLRIFAAASLQGPLDEVVADWPGEAVVSYAGSGTIARQVSLGAPADVIILANSVWMDWLSTQGHVSQTPRDILSNHLVIIGARGAPTIPAPSADVLTTQLGAGRLAIGQHQSVPAGIYAAEWLQQIQAWDALRPHLAETDNVRAALALVARGEAPLGIVYASDAQASPAVDVLYAVPAHQHSAIRYPAVAISQAGVPLLDFVASHLDRFVEAGFEAAQ